MSALSGSSSQCLWKTKTVPYLRPVSHYPSFCLACNECRLTFTLCSPEMNWNHSSYPQIPFPKDLIVDTKGPITLFLYSLSLEYKGILKALALLWWIKSTWGWKLYIWYLWMNVSNFTQIRVINFDGYSGISLLRFCHSLLHIVYWFSLGCGTLRDMPFPVASPHWFFCLSPTAMITVFLSRESERSHCTVWINKVSSIITKLTCCKMPH